MHIHIHIHTRTHTRKHTHTHTNTRTHVHTYLFSQLSIIRSKCVCINKNNLSFLSHQCYICELTYATSTHVLVSSMTDFCFYYQKGFHFYSPGYIVVFVFQTGMAIFFLVISIAVTVRYYFDPNPYVEIVNVCKYSLQLV